MVVVDPLCHLGRLSWGGGDVILVLKERHAELFCQPQLPLTAQQGQKPGFGPSSALPRAFFLWYTQRRVPAVASTWGHWPQVTSHASSSVPTTKT